MKDRPILFSATMVRAILDGRKTQTRRVVKGMALKWLSEASFTPKYVAMPENDLCPYGHGGDRLWVRETWAHVPSTAYRHSEGVQQIEDPMSAGMAAVYREGWERSSPGRWRPSIHMPRWASRITLEIISVRVEQLQSITIHDAVQEGYPVERPTMDGREPFLWFQGLWCGINGRESWRSNPWVWVIEFKRVESPHA